RPASCVPGRGSQLRVGALARGRLHVREAFRANAPRMTLSEALAPRAQPAASFEIWFAVLRDLASGRALWIRRSHLRTSAGKHGSVVWAALYDAADPKQHVDAAQLFPDVAPTDALPAPHVFAAGKLAGNLATARGPLEWSLDWQPDLPPHRM